MPEKDTDTTSKLEKKSSQAKVFDISNPNDSISSATTRPMIVTHRTLARDPMVTPPKHDLEGVQPDDDPADDQPVPLPKISKNRIEPLHTEPKNSVDESREDSSHTDTVETLDSAPDEPNSQPPVHDPASDNDTNDEEIDEDTAELDRQQAVQKAKQAEEDADQKRAEQIDRLIESKRYHVPIRTVAQRRALRATTVIVGVLFIVALLSVVAAIDYGILDIGVKLPFDLL